MAPSTEITFVERWAVSPPPHSVAAISLPLTYFDIPWLFSFPTQPLFFYHFPIHTSQFTQNIFPNLKHFLSHTLKHYFPLAGRLVTPPKCAEPRLEYAELDSVSVTIAEASAGDFNYLVGNHPRPARDFHHLVPSLETGFDSEKPLLAIQITVFPESGICLGFNLNNAVADLRTFYNFLETWGSLCRSREICVVEKSMTDRSVIRDPNGLTSMFVEQWRCHIESPQKEQSKPNGQISHDMVRGTFVLGPNDLEKIKKRTLERSTKLFGSNQLLLSPYVLACALSWTCWVRAHWSESESEMEIVDETMHYFGFIAGGITRLNYRVPSEYVGNCVSFGRSEVTRSDLIGLNGIVHAVKAIEDSIDRLDEDVLGGAKNWIGEWKELRESELHFMVIGSPKLDSYGLDFGWGRPVKFEELSINKTRAISLCESGEEVGGMEMGLSLPRAKMDVFSSLFSEGLN